jgi:hypothetical protein
VLIDDIQAGFPVGVAVPEDLRPLCQFADEGGEIGGCFEFERDGQEAAVAWFDGDEEAAAQFAVFGLGPDGSVYALWLHSGPDANRAPVVLLNSKSDGNGVIANDFRDFIRLLAIGYEEPGQYPTLEPKDSEGAALLRAWLTREFGLSPPATDEELVSAARKKHPDLAAQIRQWRDRK